MACPPLPASCSVAVQNAGPGKGTRSGPPVDNGSSAVLQAQGVMVNLSSKPMANPAVIYREVSQGEAVLVNTDTTASLVLNTTGMAVWHLLDGRRGLQEIVAAIRRRFEDVPDQATEDVRQLIEMLADEGFVGFELLDED